MAKGTRKKVFLTVFCLASVVQGMYSTYFVSILTTIERIYQIQSKTAGAILSATEMGQILGSLLIAYYGGRGNKPKWIAACMTLTAIAALISTMPHFFLNITRQTSMSAAPVADHHQSGSDLSQWQNISSVTSHLSSRTLTGQLCNEARFESQLKSASSLSNLSSTAYSNLNLSPPRESSTGPALVIFFVCLLVIGFGSTAITTLGIPFIDDIVSKEESPLYLGLTICLKIFGPALGFILGSICIQLNIDINHLLGQNTIERPTNETLAKSQLLDHNRDSDFGAWWLGIVIISLPLLVLAIPMYLLSKPSARQIKRAKRRRESQEDFADVTYQAAEDHDIVDSKDFEPHVLTIADLDVTSNGTCYSDVDTSSREVLQGKSHATRFRYTNFGKNILLRQPTIRTANDSKSAGDRHLALSSKAVGAHAIEHNNWTTTNYLIVDHFGGLQSASLSQEEAKRLCLNYCSSSASSGSSMSLQQPKPEPRPPPSTSDSSDSCASSSSSLDQRDSTSSITSKLAKAGASLSSSDMGSSLMRLLGNRLMVLRMLSGILHILSIAGFYTFLPKYLMEQFRLAPSSASAISGLAGILFVGIGAFLGGTVIRVFNVNSRVMTRWIALSSLLYAMGMLIMMQLGCPENQLVHYGGHELSPAASCSPIDKLEGCHCSPTVFEPVCLDGKTYISPCLAGCQNYSISSEGLMTYQDCGCGSGMNAASVDGLASRGSVASTTATQGHCLLSCDNMIWYIVIFSTFTLIHASCEVGSVMFNLRCVSSNDRTLALGLITFTSSLFGTIPCSIIYGSVIDFTCIHWDSSSVLAGGESLEQRGACRAYENKSFREHLHGLTALVMLAAFLVDCATCYCAREVNFYDESHQTPVLVGQPTTNRLNDSHSEEKLASHEDEDLTATVQELNKPAETI